MNEKLTELKDMVAALQKRNHRAMITTSIIYIILIVIVAGYTSILSRQITTIATPQAFIEMALDYPRVYLPQIAQELRDNAENLAVVAATKTVDSSLNAIPQLGDFAVEQLDLYCDNICTEVESKYLPTINEYLDESIAEVLKDKEAVVDGSMGKAITASVCQRVDAELQDMLDQNFYNGLSTLRGHIKALVDTPDADMNRKMKSEKLFLTYWVWLTENAELAPEDGSFDSIGAIVRTVNAAATKAGINVDFSAQVLPEATE